MLDIEGFHLKIATKQPQRDLSDNEEYPLHLALLTKGQFGLAEYTLFASAGKALVIISTAYVARRLDADPMRLHGVWDG